MGKIKNLDIKINELAAEYDQVHRQRIEAFKRYEDGDTQNLSSPNLLPENVRYKLLERYHYLGFLKKLYDLVSRTGEIDTIDDIEDVKKILGPNFQTEEAKETCDEYRKGGFRNHDQAGDPATSGKDHFNSALKRWNDRATGKKKNKPTVKEDRKSDVVESINEYGNLLLEVLGEFKYELPKDKEQQLYDFYTATMMAPGVSPGEGLLTHVKQMPDEDLDYAVKDTQDCIYEALKKNFLDAVLFSLGAEVRHVLDTNTIEKIMSNIEKNLGEKYVKLFKTYLKDMVVAKQYPDFQR
jgi:hypothetical protein